MNKKNTKPLSDIEQTTLWMAIRYSMNGQTISTATLPEMIIKEYYHRLSKHDKKTIVRDLEENEKRHDGEYKAFGHPTIDRPTWLKFWKALDDSSHYDVELIDNSKCIVFEANDRIYPLESYLKNPHEETYIPKENIKK
jgi:hypothetical protein